MKCRCLGLDNSRYCTGWVVADIDMPEVELPVKTYANDKKKKVKELYVDISLLPAISDNQIAEGMKIVDYGFIDTHDIKEEGKTLDFIQKKFTTIIEFYKPNVIAAEQMFIGQNRQTGIVLAGIHALMKLIAYQHDNIPVKYYAIQTMKSTVLDGLSLIKEDGNRKTGDDLKKEVADRIFKIFPRSTFVKEITDDVTDAISAVITYIKYYGQVVGKQSADRKTSTAKKKTLTIEKSKKKVNTKQNKKSTKKQTKKKTKKKGK